MKPPSTGSAWPGIVLAIAMPLFLMAVAFHVDDLQLRHHTEQDRKTVADAAAQLRSQLEAEITARIAMADSLASFALALPAIEDGTFSQFSSGLMRQRKGIRALQLAQQGTVRFVYPLQGNQAAIGHDLLADPQRAALVQEAIKRRTVVLAGPYELRQGGLGAVARKPIFRRMGNVEDFWGLAIVVIDVPELLEQAGLISPAVEHLRIAVRGRDGTPDADSVFFGDPGVFAGDPVLETVSFPSGTWQIAALPAGGWSEDWPGRSLFLFTSAGVGLLAMGLSLALARQTRDLRLTALEAIASHARFQTLFDESLQFIVTLTPDGTVTAINRAAANMMGVVPSAVIGRKCWDSPWWSQDPGLAALLGDGVTTAARGEIVRFEACRPRAGGGTIWVDFSIKAMRNHMGIVTGLIAEGRDVTERKQAEQAVRENEALYHAMFLSNTAIKLLIDPDKAVIVDANAAAVDFYGYPRDQLIGKPVCEVNTLTPEEIAQELLAARTEKRGCFHFTHRLASGELRHVDVYSGPVARGGRTLLHSIIHDVTEQVRLERELRRSNAELEQFAYAASHDLREPLRMVSGFVGLLKRRYGQALDDNGRELLAFAEDGAQRMDRMIVDLLEYSRVGRFERPIQAWPLHDLVESSLAQLRLAIAEAGIVMSVQADMPQVLANREEMVRALTNIIGNAVKYRRTDVTPNVAVGCRISGGSAVISVADNGIGIAPEYFERIFQLFQRLHGREQYEGTGIGLALVKKVFERHGGKVWVESAGEGQGSTFYATLPLASAQTVSPAAVPSA